MPVRTCLASNIRSICYCVAYSTSFGTGGPDHHLSEDLGGISVIVFPDARELLFGLLQHQRLARLLAHFVEQREIIQRFFLRYSPHRRHRPRPFQSDRAAGVVVSIHPTDGKCAGRELFPAQHLLTGAQPLPTGARLAGQRLRHHLEGEA